MATKPKSQQSFPQLHYPSLRDEGWKDASQWLDGKNLDDGAGSFWRVHDKLYDLTDFIGRHPGGEDWLVLTKGTDITEAFESHHIGTTPETLLPKFYIKDATTPRNSPFTFKESDFYKTLKTRLRDDLERVDVKRLTRKSDIITDVLLLATLSLYILTCSVDSSIHALPLVCFNGLVLAWCIVASHNYLHRRDNWRMYLWNLGSASYRDARITHALSHHMYPNTLMDVEVSGLEPLAHYFPGKQKPANLEYFMFYAPMLFLIPFWGQFVRKFVMAIAKEDFFKKYLFWNDLITLAPPVMMYWFTSAPLLKILFVWIATVSCANGVLMVIGLTAGHHHPDAFHEGDIPKGSTVDWGEHQLETVVERTEASGTLFMSLTHFGDHGLHHLFPTIDHAVLPLLYPTFYKVCDEFKSRNAELRMAGQIDQFSGHHKQIYRQEATTVEERYKKKTS